MQIRKCVLAVCFALAALSVQAAGVETEAQAKAREALQKKLKEIDAQAAVTNAAPVTNAPTPAEPVPAAAAAPAETQPPPQPAAPVAATAAAASASVPPATAQTGGVPTPADPAVIEKARESMRKKMDEVIAQMPPDAPPPGATPPHNPNVVPPPSPPSKPPKTTTLADLPKIEAPALPISSEKKQRLDSLLSRYKADQITPDQYQAERAKILQGE